MDETSESEKKKSMTHEERLKLAEKLDRELDDFIAGLEKRSYTEGWPEDRWEEEMEKHPFFMTKVPEDGKLPPLLEGIQQLKYDETENTPLELAMSYKEDGNFNFKYKKYRMAIISYTEGIRRKCEDNDMQAQLYSNRAAAHIHLSNFRSGLADCKQALKFSPDYEKAKVKAAQCCVKLKQFDDAMKYCDDILEKKPTDSNVLKIRTEAVALKKIDERDKRKEGIKDRKLRADLVLLKSAIEERKVKYHVKGDVIESLESLPERPKLVDGKLSWPVFFLYPEYSNSDFVEEFHEDTTFSAMLHEIFSTPPAWDTVAEYKPAVLKIFYESIHPEILYSVDLNCTLGSVLSNQRFVVRDWTPSFMVFVENSPSEKNFLKMYKLVT